MIDYRVATINYCEKRKYNIIIVDENVQISKFFNTLRKMMFQNQRFDS